MKEHKCDKIPPQYHSVYYSDIFECWTIEANFISDIYKIYDIGYCPYCGLKLNEKTS